MENRSGSSLISSSVKPFRWRVGYWLNSKKSKKFNFDELTELCKSVDIELVQLDLDGDKTTQGPFDAIIHKLSDVLVQADKGEEEAQKMIARFEKYVNSDPNVVVFDPLRSVRTLCDRYLQYSLVRDVCRTDNVCMPPFVDFTDYDPDVNLKKMKSVGVTFPCVCKPLVAHGSTLAHEMSIIFCERGLLDVKPPCVAQSFVPHNALLYKIFVIGDRYFIRPRPSLKNFSAGEFPTIFFHTHDVSKDGCTSELSEAIDLESPTIPMPSDEKIAAVVRDIRERTGLSLFGVDVIVEDQTQFHYIIDVNALPSYDGVPDLHEHLLQLLSETLNNRDIEMGKRQANKVSPSRTSSVPAISVSFSLAASPTNSVAMASLMALGEKLVLEGRGTPADSGISSCTESDTSDCERKLMAALRIRHQQQQSEPIAIDVGGPSMFTPSWKRIKKFYGIPRPASRLVRPFSTLHTRRDAGDCSKTSNDAGGSKQRQAPSPPQATAQNKQMTPRKPRSQTLP